MAKRYIPRWLYTEATVLERVAANPLLVNYFIKIPPGTLANDTIWPMKLEYLCIAGRATSVDGTCSGAFGIGDSLFAEIGISQEGDVNVVSSMVNGSFSCIHPCTVGSLYSNPGYTHRLKYPYRLSRDNGFVVRRRSRIDLIDQTNYATIALRDLGQGIVMRGVDVVTGKPVIIAGSPNMQLSNGISEVTYDSADLLNRGKHDVDIYEITVNATELSGGLGPSSIFLTTGIFDSYLVNPLLGERWMPGEVEVPVGCIAPYGCMGFQYGNVAGTLQDRGPHTFVFNDGTYLNRRQEIALRLSRSFYDLAQPVHVALFGYLEVE